jgi:predicted Rossmann fold nucleotide-binding protein DprA/Smf involved in DNA uptake
MSDYDHLDSLQLIKILELRDKKFAALEKRFKNFAEQVNNVLAQINIENKARIAELEAENDRLADDCVRMEEKLRKALMESDE